MRHRTAGRTSATVAGAMAAIISSSAVSQSPPAAGPTLEASLMRLDQSDCTNSNVTASDPSLLGGTVRVVRQPNGTTSVKVDITAKPNTTYHFYLKCVRQLGDIATHDEGDGEGVFEFATTETGAVYAFDMYPEGAPLGDKYQRVQVKFP